MIEGLLNGRRKEFRVAKLEMTLDYGSLNHEKKELTVAHRKRAEITIKVGSYEATSNQRKGDKMQ